MLFDTHAHLDSMPFEKDLEAVIKRCQKNNIRVINVGVNYESSKKAIETADSYPNGIFAAIGLHPDQLGEGEIKIEMDNKKYIIKKEKEFNFEKYKKLALSSKKVVAIGEIGLDYYRKPKTKNKLEIFKRKQKELLLREIELAQELNLPIIFHCRMAHNDLLEIINTKYEIPARNAIVAGGQDTKVRGVIHCFTRNLKQAEEYLEMGFYLGFGGIIFKMNLDEIIKKIPLDRILVETDCPFLTPPQIKTNRNEPAFVKYAAEKIAEIKKMSFQEIEKATTQNAEKLFGV